MKYGLVLGFKGYGKTSLLRQYVDSYQARGGSTLFINSKCEAKNRRLGAIAHNGREVWKLMRTALERNVPFRIVLERGYKVDLNPVWELACRVGRMLLAIDELHFYGDVSRIDPELRAAVLTGRSQGLDIIATTQTPRGVHADYKALLDWCACFSQQDPFYATQVADRFFDRRPGIALQLEHLPKFEYLHLGDTGRIVKAGTRAGV